MPKSLTRVRLVRETNAIRLRNEQENLNHDLEFLVSESYALISCKKCNECLRLGYDRLLQMHVIGNLFNGPCEEKKSE